MGDFETGIQMLQSLGSLSSAGTLTQDLTVEMSENDIGVATVGGIMIDERYELMGGFTDLAIDVDLLNNSIALISMEPILEPDMMMPVGMSVGGTSGTTAVQEGMNLSANVLIAGNNITGGEYAMDVSTFGGVLDPEFNVTMIMVIEDNEISGANTGIQAFGNNITITGNVIDAHDRYILGVRRW